MHVLLVTPYPEASATGVGSFVRSLREGLDASGVSTTVIEPQGPGIPGFANLALAVRSAVAVVRLRRPTDVVHCQQLHLQTLAAGLAARILGKSLVVTVHGRSPVPGGARAIVFRVVERLCLGLTRNLVFVAESLRAQFGGRGQVVPNGVDVQSIRGCRSSRSEVRRELGIDDAFVVVFLGRATVDKGVPVLVEAWETVCRRHASPISLLIVGPVDEEVGRLLPKGGPVLTGATRTPWRFLVAGDIFVLPSTHEGFPLSVLEAMAAEVPVVATDVGDVRRIVEPGKTGVLIPPSDVAALVDAIESVYAHPTDARLMATRAADSVAAKFGLTAMAENYRRVYTADGRRETKAM